jgi:hypothetical protein
MPELLDGLRGPYAQGVPGCAGEVGERTGGLRRHRQVHQTRGGQADESAVHVARQVDGGARA